MHIRFIRPWGNFPAGGVAKEYHPGAAAELIRRGIAVAVDAKAATTDRKAKGSR